LRQKVTALEYRIEGIIQNSKENAKKNKRNFRKQMDLQYLIMTNRNFRGKRAFKRSNN
jgi:hypothetical protein